MTACETWIFLNNSTVILIKIYARICNIFIDWRCSLQYGHFFLQTFSLVRWEFNIFKVKGNSRTTVALWNDAFYKSTNWAEFSCICLCTCYLTSTSITQQHREPEKNIKTYLITYAHSEFPKLNKKNIQIGIKVDSINSGKGETIPIKWFLIFSW